MSLSLGDLAVPTEEDVDDGELKMPALPTEDSVVLEGQSNLLQKDEVMYEVSPGDPPSPEDETQMEQEAASHGDTTVGGICLPT